MEEANFLLPKRSDFEACKPNSFSYKQGNRKFGRPEPRDPFVSDQPSSRGDDETFSPPHSTPSLIIFSNRRCHLLRLNEKNMDASFWHWSVRVSWTVAALILLYLARLNYVLNGVPNTVRKLSGSRWTTEELRKISTELSENPIDYKEHIPPKLDRRYIVTGGSGRIPNTHGEKPMASVI